ncbi:MAG: ferrochelatase [Terriglobales bacterium]|jgi:ferrochelatase
MKAVLLLAHGSPDTATEADIREFLKNVTGGRALPDAAVEEIRHRYEQIGRSPLTDITMRQAKGLERELGMRVYVGMRNWRPFISDAVKQMAADSVSEAVAICLAPQNSRTSVGLYRKALEGDGGVPFAVDFVKSWHDNPKLIAAFAGKLLPAWKRACEESGVEVPIIFTAHSVPSRTVADGDPYEIQARETARAVALACDLPESAWCCAFQSQGISGGPWIGPTVEETILALKNQGATAALIQPIGFVCDHVEVLYDIDIAFKKFAEEHGMKLWRTESLNHSPLFIEALAELVRTRQ